MGEVELTPEALEQAAALPKTINKRVRNVLERLRKWPAVSGVKSLSGNLAGWYRIRTGDYRIPFHVESGIVIVDKIGHRSDFYEH
jgi:mRNA interferase RelE/StbE